ncbi:MAG: hypothetical protein GY723_17815 [bacterium]|nr:hypothetical protein [bacterium]MCP5068551.1 hypothetical protein [bacterium]
MENARSPILVSLLALVVALSAPAGAVVTNVSIVSKGEPLPGATLQILDPAGDVVAEEETDEHGACVVDLPEGDGYQLRTADGALLGATFAAGATLEIEAPASLAAGHAPVEPGTDDPRLAEIPPETLKGDTVVGEAMLWPAMAAVAGSALAVTRCDPELEAQPLVIGTAEGFSAAGLLKGFGKSMFSTGLGILSGGMVSVGGGSRRNKPEVHWDDVKRRAKSKVSHPEGHTRVRIGSMVEEDQLIISTNLEKTKGKGTLHTLYLETDDCQRFWPEDYLAYSLWGEWNLSVSFTKTSETYQDGQLVDRTSSSGGWSTGWQRLPGGIDEVVSLSDPASMEALTEYQVALLEEMGVPAWRKAGFSAPTSGARSMGAIFPATPELLEPIAAGQMRAVVHVTREVDGVFQTTALPMRMTPTEKKTSFALLEGAFPGAQ